MNSNSIFEPLPEDRTAFGAGSGKVTDHILSTGARRCVADDRQLSLPLGGAA